MDTACAHNVTETLIVELVSFHVIRSFTIAMEKRLIEKKAARVRPPLDNRENYS